MSLLPVVFCWHQIAVVDDDGVISKRWVMDPLRRYDNLARRQYDDGAEYPLIVELSRDMRSHRHFFAQINDGYDSLPEGIAPRFNSPEHMRKWLLVETGWFDEKEFECESEANAQKMARFCRDTDRYARVFLLGKKVIVRRAKSQDLSSMGREDFEASKKAVLEALDGLLGMKPGTMRREAGKPHA